MTTARRQLYHLGGEVFISKNDMAQHVRTILHRWQPGVPLYGPDDLIVRDLLARHPHAEQKIGIGVRAIVVRRDQRGSNRHFHILRIDGSDEDFSYLQCIQPSTRKADVTSAFRAAIIDDVMSFKAQFFAGYGALAGSLCCPISYEPLTPAGSHVDHRPPKTFKRLLAQYLAEHTLDIAAIPTYAAPAGEGKILSGELAAHFRLWHRDHAELRVISSYANLHLVHDED